MNGELWSRAGCAARYALVAIASFVSIISGLAVEKIIGSTGR